MLIIIIIIILFFIFLLKKLNEKSLPLLISYGEIETKKIATLVINETVLKNVTNGYDADDMFIITKKENGDVSSIDFNSKIINEILINTSKEIEKNIKKISEGDVDELNKDILEKYNKEKLKKGIFYEVPIGIIFNNVFLSNILPKIPVKLELIGNAFCKIDTNINSYGINNALLKVNIDISISVRIIMPFISKITEISTSIPIAMKLIQGNIPSYYYSGYLQSPSIN